MRKLFLVIVTFAATSALAADTNICNTIAFGDLERMQNAKLLLTKPGAHDDGKLTTSTCYYRMDPDSMSVSLEVISRSKGDSLNPRQYWQSHFNEEGPDKDEEEVENREKKHPPEKIGGVGEDAYWVDAGRDGALYMLQGERIVRLSLGGKTPQYEKKNRAVQLARLIAAKLIGQGAK